MKPQLLMICLLRSSAAALATPPRPPGGVVGGAAARGKLKSRFAGSVVDDAERVRAGERPSLTSGHIAFRLARRTDVPQIQECNLATLPENYNANFYVNHMRTWPELTLVAEHIPEGCGLGEDGGGSVNGGDGGGITPLRDYWKQQQRRGGSYANGDGVPRREIVGYVLGKFEERQVNQYTTPSRPVPLYDEEDASLSSYLNDNRNSDNGRVRFPSRRSRPPPRQQSPQPSKERMGHVTSLAVHHRARRMGVASSLMKQLHYHLRECYHAEAIGLHVRISNKAAVRLYCDDGYDVADIIPMYYGDGEDAYFMKKDFDKGVALEAPPERQRQWRRGEKEREEWLNRDARSGGSFFDGRKSMRETLSKDERAWVTRDVINNGNRRPPVSSGGRPPVNGGTNGSPSLSGQFRRSFRTFFNGGEQYSQQPQQRRSQGRYQPPPWETGPEGLRLPRYTKVPAARGATAGAEISGGSTTGLSGLATNRQRGANTTESYDDDEEASSNLGEARVASTSV